MSSKSPHCHLCTKRFTLLRRRHFCPTCYQDFCKKCTDVYTSLHQKSTRLCTPCVIRMHPSRSSQANSGDRIFHGARALESSRRGDLDQDADSLRPVFLSSRSIYGHQGAMEVTKGRASSSGTSVTAIMDDDDQSSRNNRLVATPEDQVVLHPDYRPSHPSRHRRSIPERPSRLLLTPRQRVDVRAKRAVAAAP